MIFYAIKHGERTIDYVGTQADAKQAIKNHSLTTVTGETLEWCEAEVPVDKPSLLAWLKVNALGGEEEEF